MRYYLVELTADDGMKGIRSSLITQGKFPQLETGFENLKKAGYKNIHVICVTQISRDTYNYLKAHIESIPPLPKPETFLDAFKKVSEELSEGSPDGKR